VDLLPFDEYVRSLPRKRMSAGVLLRDSAERVLLVVPSYKPHWDIPGGSVDTDEAPWATAARELREELGIERTIATPLVIDHVAPTERMPEGIAWIFDGGLITDGEVERLTLTDPEIVSAGLHALDEVSGKLKPALARRLAVALDVAAAGGPLALCEDGHRVAP
jgi:8-oxo-dGTP pyrophosphatase MutT (NUDIX family)